MTSMKTQGKTTAERKLAGAASPPPTIVFLTNKLIEQPIRPVIIYERQPHARVDSLQD
jgi:hypothetical protein